jgi:hypothetical protein
VYAAGKEVGHMSDKPEAPAANKQPQIQIQIPPEVQNGAYANLTFVSHTETEFVFDFVYVLPHEPRGVVRSRVIASPKQARRMLAALQDNVQRYEQRYGQIDVIDKQPVH